jgi:hypothetical protein
MKILNQIITVGLVLTSLNVFADRSAIVGTQDNLDYVVTVSENSDFKSCARLVCAVSKKFGNGNCEKMSAIGIVAVNLTTLGFDILTKQTRCELVIEPSEVVNASPRIGRHN